MLEQSRRIYEALGGTEGCHRLSVGFYARVAQDPILRPLFPSLHCAVDALAGFLAHFLGGEGDYAATRWSVSLRESHQRFKIGRKERTAWLKNMRRALNDAKISEPAHSALNWFFEQSSAYIVSGTKAPAAEVIHEEIAARWDVQCALEEAVAAARRGDSHNAIRLAEESVLRSYLERDRAALVNLLVVMSGSADAVMLDYVRQRLTADPTLARERYSSGRTLLHGAAARGSVPIVRLLLDLGADSGIQDKAGHAPLYCVGNECGTATGGELVRLLITGGAKVDAHDGVKHCTALHMAARRGTVLVAEALLDCGADIEARDSLGETPLRRAVNCGKAQVAALLLRRGANVHSRGSKGLTPFEAARTAAMKHVLEPYIR